MVVVNSTNLSAQIGNETVEDKAKRLNIDMEDVDPATCTAAVVNGAELLEMSTPELDDVLK